MGGDGQTDGWTYVQTYGNSPLFPTGHRPFGAAAQKGTDKEFIVVAVVVVAVLFRLRPQRTDVL